MTLPSLDKSPSCVSRVGFFCDTCLISEMFSDENQHNKTFLHIGTEHKEVAYESSQL